MIENDETLKSLKLILADGQVTELRAFNGSKTISGYFTDRNALAEAAEKLTSEMEGIYFVPNPISKIVEADSLNTYYYGISGGSTNDGEISKRNWFLIDCDPNRPPKTSSSESEHAFALEKARKIRKELENIGWPKPIFADSGNGGHLMYRIDLPVKDDNLVKRCLEVLSSQYSDDKVKVDTCVYNPSRIWKLYGTWARKGDNTEERPHRQSKILWEETPDILETVPTDKLKELASLAPVTEPVKSYNLKNYNNFSLENWIEEHGDKLNIYGLSSMRPWLNGGKKWIFNVCPWNSEHDNKSAFIVQNADGVIGAGCHHDSCRDKNWHSLRDLVEPERLNKIFPMTDYGNAERLVYRHGNEICFCFSMNKWLFWNEKYWEEDNSGEIFRRAKATIRSIYAEAASIKDDEKRKDLIKWASQSESEHRLKAMIALAESEEGIPVSLNKMDANPWLFNVQNGTLNLKTGILQPHNRDDLITKISPVAWKGLNETNPIWDKFLNDVTNNNAAIKGFIQRASGYSLSGDTSEEVLFFVHGPAASGKSTFIEAVKNVIGDYGSTADFESFLKRPSVGSARNDIARLAGARLAASVEVDEGKSLAEGLIKTITGGDRVTARFLYHESFEFDPSFKLWLVANHAPKVNADDDAMWRRIVKIPFECVVPKAKRDPNIKKILKDVAAAGPAILAWMVKGCLDWQKTGLSIPKEICDATEGLRLEMDTLGQFFEDYCKFNNNWESSSSLYNAYRQWSGMNSEQNIVEPNIFYSRLRSMGLKAEKKNGVRGWFGIGLNKSSDTPPTDPSLF